jgi:hypothetical protein
VIDASRAPVTHAVEATPTPSPSTTRPPAADPLEAAGAIVAIAFALAAAVIGYRIIRGGRGL